MKTNQHIKKIGHNFVTVGSMYAGRVEKKSYYSQLQEAKNGSSTTVQTNLGIIIQMNPFAFLTTGILKVTEKYIVLEVLEKNLLPTKRWQTRTFCRNENDCWTIGVGRANRAIRSPSEYGDGHRREIRKTNYYKELKRKPYTKNPNNYL